MMLSTLFFATISLTNNLHILKNNKNNLVGDILRVIVILIGLLLTWTGVSTLCAEVTLRVKVITFARGVKTLVSCQQQSYFNCL